MKKNKDKDNPSVQEEMTDQQAEQKVEEAKATEETKPESSSEATSTENQDKTADDTAALTKSLEDLKIQYATLNDRYLRLSAEFDNYRKRTLKEKADLIQWGGEDVLKEILPVVDDFERGLRAVDSSEDVQSIKEGINLIYNKLRDYLTKRGVKEIEAHGLAFNTDQHEAITKIPAPDPSLQGKVVDVISKGYTLHEKVIRFAKVVVGE